MKTTLDIIKEQCTENGMSLSGLEKALNYGNGAISKSGHISFDRIIEIADYFKKPTDYFRERDGEYKGFANCLVLTKDEYNVVVELRSMDDASRKQATRLLMYYDKLKEIFEK